MKHFILDAFNIIHKDNELSGLMKKSLDLAANTLLNYVTMVTDKYPAYKFTVVYDADPAVFQPGNPNIQIINAGAGRIADEIIKKLVKNENQPSLTTVVSSDIELYKFARIYACTPMYSEEYIIYAKSLAEERASVSSYFDKPDEISEEEFEEMQLLFEDDKGLEAVKEYTRKRKKELDTKFENKVIDTEEKKSRPRKEKQAEPDPLAEDKPDLITRDDIEEFKRLFEDKNK